MNSAYKLPFQKACSLHYRNDQNFCHYLSYNPAFQPHTLVFPLLKICINEKKKGKSLFKGNFFSQGLFALFKLMLFNFGYCKAQDPVLFPNSNACDDRYFLRILKTANIFLQIRYRTSGRDKVFPFCGAHQPTAVWGTCRNTNPCTNHWDLSPSTW